MERIALGIAALLVASTVAFAAGPAKTMDTAAGKVWTDDKGMTLYTFDDDRKGKSNCYDDCAKGWPPFTAAADAKPEGKWTAPRCGPIMASHSTPGSRTPSPAT